MPDTTALLTLDQVSLYRRAEVVLCEINLRLMRGEIVALCGANGAGKTSLLKLGGGDWRADTGTVQYGAPDLRVTMVPDKAALYDNWPVGVFLNWCAQSIGVTDYAPLLKRVIVQCGLQTVLQEPCTVLSHGYRQRVSLAQALVSSPDLLLLDEPANGLDISQQQALRDILRAVSVDCGILLTHHDYAEVAALADRLYWLENANCREIPLPMRVNSQVWVRWRDANAARRAVIDSDQCYGCYSAHLFADESSRAQLMAHLAADPAVLEIASDMPAGVVSTLLEMGDD